jgi:hypothetical protein
MYVKMLLLFFCHAVKSFFKLLKVSRRGHKVLKVFFEAIFRTLGSKHDSKLYFKRKDVVRVQSVLLTKALYVPEGKFRPKKLNIVPQGPKFSCAGTRFLVILRGRNFRPRKSPKMQ